MVFGLLIVGGGRVKYDMSVHLKPLFITQHKDGNRTIPP